MASVQQKTQVIYLTSKNATSYNNGTYNSDLTFQIPRPITKPKDTDLNISVKQFVFPNSFYTVTDSNNELIVDLGGVETTYTLTNGNYTIDTLADELNTKMVGDDYTVTSDSVSLKLTFVNGGDDFTILSTSTCLGLLGFTEGQDHDSTAQSLTSEYPVDLGGTTMLYIAIPNLSVNNVASLSTSVQRSSIIVSVPVDSSAGLFCYYTNDANLSATTQEETISELHLKIFGEDLETLVDFQDQNWMMTLEVAFVPQQ